MRGQGAIDAFCLSRASRHCEDWFEIDPPQKRVCAFAWDTGLETVVTVILQEIDNGRLRVVFCQMPFETSGDRGGHCTDWNSRFVRLVDAFAAAG